MSGYRHWLWYWSLHVRSEMQSRLGTEDEIEGPGPLTQSSDASLFEEPETVQGSSWQYELQQLRSANQRSHEELHALEGAFAKGGPGVGSGTSSSTTVHIAAVPFRQSCSPCPSSVSVATILIPRQPQLSQIQIHYTPWMRSNLSMSLFSRADPPSWDWSSLAGGNGQGRNPLKRSWRSEDGPMT
ncbi:hypothetical protein OG21DRAFT_1512201 [Imleria badia]|nr:hypothetical protein OG21DRAFT_1512201 [Imleria badia]